MMSPTGKPFTHLLVLSAFPGRILRVSLLDGQVTELLSDAGAFPDGIAVVDDTLWWSVMGEATQRPGMVGEAALDFSARNGGLFTLDLDTGARVEVVADGTVTTPKQLTARGRWIYWADREGGTVSRLNIDTRVREELIRTLDPSDPCQQCVGVAVDDREEWVYWTQKGPSDGNQGRIFRQSLVDPSPDPQLLWEELPEPIDLELLGGYLYWTDRGTGPTGNTLNRAALPTPANPKPAVEILAGGFHEAIGLAIDPTTETAYVSDLAGDIRLIPLTTGHGEPRVIARVGAPTGLTGY